MTCGIYKITNTLTGKCYVGQSVNIEKRFKVHKSQYKGAMKKQRIQFAITKYGVENFKFEVLEELPNDQHVLNKKEEEYIAVNEAYTKGYNLLPTATTCPSKMPDIANKISRTKKGKPLSDTNKQGLSLALKGRTRPDISMLLTGRENTACSKQVLCVQTGQIFRSVKVAALELGLHITHIAKVCRGELHATGIKKYPPHGLTFKYTKETK